MGMRFEGKEAGDALSKAFKMPIEDFTAEQLWVLTKMAKHIRLRCRNNTAFNNYMNRVFTGAQFKGVPKEYKGRPYTGLQITTKGVAIEDDGADEEGG